MGNSFFLDVSVEDSVDPSPSYYALLGIYGIEFESGERVRVQVPEALRSKGEPLHLQFTVKARDTFYNWATEAVDVTLRHDMRK